MNYAIINRGVSNYSPIVMYDQGNLHLIYEKWPEHFRDAARIYCKPDHDVDFYNSIVLCGVGGSATSCDILNDLVQSFSARVPSIVLRRQYMPYYVNKHSLVIVNSVSGNTQEAISMVEEASDRNAEVICISSGGRLKEMSANNGHRHIEIPNLGVPRASLPYLIMPGLRLINPFLNESLDEDISSIEKNISNIAKDISSNVPLQSNIAKKIASFLEGSSVAMCFTSPSLVSVGTRFKNSLNENAKVHCIKESVLEASHNEVVPFTYNNAFVRKVLLVRNIYEQPIVNERFKKIKSFLTKIGQPLMEVNAGEKNLFSTIISLIYILDYSSIYLALSRKIDPSPTPAIDILKKIQLE